jgi:hypothetical protein
MGSVPGILLYSLKVASGHNAPTTQLLPLMMYPDWQEMQEVAD